jgi:hypothetical protein
VSDPDELVVVPLIPLQSEPTTEVMLRMLLDRQAVTIQAVPTKPGNGRSGMVAQTSGAFAKAVGQAVQQIGRTPATDGLYRVILPNGSLARDLVPAVGGGFRGMVRTAGTQGFTGQVRLIPAAAGGAAAIAAGPLIATVGLAVAGELLAQHQMNKKLDSIRSAVQGITLQLSAQNKATLKTAEQQAQKVAGYLLDRAQLPAINSASVAFGELNSLTNQQIDRLDHWRGVAADLADSKRVSATDLMTRLVGKHDDPIGEFEQAVSHTYESLALNARVVVLEKIASEFSNPERSLPHVEEVLRRELAALAERQTQLANVLDDLSSLQIDGGRVRPAGKQTIGVRTSFGRLSRAIHSMPDGIPMLTQSDRTVIELAPGPDGLSVIAPGRSEKGRGSKARDSRSSGSSASNAGSE